MKKLTKKEHKKFTREIDLKRNIEIVVVLENIQYARNVASAFRLADAAGVKKLVMTGISKRPPFGKELTQVSRKKEKSVKWEYEENVTKALNKLKKEGYWICALEATDSSFVNQKLPVMLKGKAKVCFVAGSEVFGVTNKAIESTDAAVYIPMYGRGASINVSHAIAVALFSF